MSVDGDASGVKLDGRACLATVSGILGRPDARTTRLMLKDAPDLERESDANSLSPSSRIHSPKGTIGQPDLMLAREHIERRVDGGRTDRLDQTPTRKIVLSEGPHHAARARTGRD